MKDPIHKFIYSKALLVFMVLSSVYIYRISEWCNIVENETTTTYRKVIYFLTVLIALLLISSKFTPKLARLWTVSLLLALIAIKCILVLLYCRDTVVYLSNTNNENCTMDNHHVLVMRMMNIACIIMAWFLLVYMVSLTTQPILNKLK